MSDDSNGRDRLAQALVRAHDEFGVDPLDDPLRATAVVADLVGHPTRTDIDDIALLRATLLELQRSDGGDVDREAALEALTADGAGRARAAQMLDLALDTLGLSAVRPTFWSTPRILAAAGAGAVAVVIVLIVVLLPSPDDDEAATPAASPTTNAPATTEQPNAPATTEALGSTTTTEATTTTSTTTTAPEQPRNGLVATFEPVREGPFLVTRGWRVTPNQTEFVGITRIELFGDGPATGSHREFPPPGAVPGAENLMWTPAPVALVNTTGVFNVSLEGDDVSLIEYRTPLDAPEVLTEDDVLAWFEEWRPLAEELRSTLGDADALLEPVIEIEEI